SPVIRESACGLRNADTCPALRVQSATWSLIQRTWAHAASRLAASTLFLFGSVYWCGIVHTTGCLNRRGTGAATKSTFASRRPVKFQEPAIQRPSLPAMNASRQFALAGGVILCWLTIAAQNSAT